MNSDNSGSFDYVAKVVMLGDSAVGKTNILSRFCKDEFSLNPQSTIGVEFSSSKVTLSDNKIIQLSIWDTAGQERYKTITNNYYSRAKGACVVFDVTRYSSFQNVDNWVTGLKEITGDDISILLIGNKTDLKHLRAVEKEEGIEKAKTLNLLSYIEASAMNNTNITESFVLLAEEIYRKDQLKIEEIPEDCEIDKGSFIIREGKKENSIQGNCKC